MGNHSISMQWFWLSGRRRKEKKGLKIRRPMKQLQNEWETTNMFASSRSAASFKAGHSPRSCRSPNLWGRVGVFTLRHVPFHQLVGLQLVYCLQWCSSNSLRSHVYIFTFYYYLLFLKKCIIACNYNSRFAIFESGFSTVKLNASLSFSP